MSIKFVVFDYDGVFTNGHIYYDNNNIVKYYDVKDGMGIKLLKDHGIKTGLISSFMCERVDKDSLIQFMDRFKFDYIFIGDGNKKEIIERWMSELNYKYENVAYIGDDVNDISIIDNVAISGCPNDAHSDVKRICNFRCIKNGGNGCIREFCDYILNGHSNIKDRCIYHFMKQVEMINVEHIKEISYIINSRKQVICTGIGKSGNIAHHLSTLLNSISIYSVYLDPFNAIHGDIGVIQKDACLIVFSKSGSYKHLEELFRISKIKKSYIIGVCCDNSITFSDRCDYFTRIPIIDELLHENHHIPTNSCISQLLFCNILVSMLSSNVSLEQYHQNHYGGCIGVKLRTFRDCYVCDNFPIVTFNNSIQTSIVYKKMALYSMKVVIFVDNSNVLIGMIIIDDLLKIDANLDEISIEHMNKAFITCEELDKIIDKSLNIMYLPVIDNERKLVGIVDCGLR
jgi:3-deoxy-D-manno-octulosonate 8-phosphate phosphatase (KDO 8-P phosphatase)